MVIATALALGGPVALHSHPAAAQNILEMLFGGGAPQRPQQRGAPPQANFFADPFGLNQQQSAPSPQPRQTVSGGGPAFCVRPCDGKYFALQVRGGMTAAQMCTMFCPAGNAKVYYGSNIDYATASNGQRYPDSENAYAYRKALKADCTCNGRDPAGLAPVDLSLDTSLRPGDIIATSDGLVAYSGPRGGGGQPADFQPVSSYPGLNSDMRARLSEMKVAPVRAEMVTSDTQAAGATAEVSASVALPLSIASPMSIAPKPATSREKRADVN